MEINEELVMLKDFDVAMANENISEIIKLITDNPILFTRLNEKLSLNNEIITAFAKPELVSTFAQYYSAKQFNHLKITDEKQIRAFILSNAQLVSTVKPEEFGSFGFTPKELVSLVVQDPSVYDLIDVSKITNAADKKQLQEAYVISCFVRGSDKQVEQLAQTKDPELLDIMDEVLANEIKESDLNLQRAEKYKDTKNSKQEAQQISGLAAILTVESIEKRHSLFADDPKFTEKSTSITESLNNRLGKIIDLVQERIVNKSQEIEDFKTQTNEQIEQHREESQTIYNNSVQRILDNVYDQYDDELTKPVRRLREMSEQELEDLSVHHGWRYNRLDKKLQAANKEVADAKKKGLTPKISKEEIEELEAKLDKIGERENEKAEKKQKKVFGGITIAGVKETEIYTKQEKQIDSITVPAGVTPIGKKKEAVVTEEKKETVVTEEKKPATLGEINKAHAKAKADYEASKRYDSRESGR